MTAWVLGDQLAHDNPALEGADRVLIVESRRLLADPRIHRQKAHLILTAMRRFAARLAPLPVDLRAAPTLADGLRAHLDEHEPDRVRLLEPSSAGAHRRLAALPGVEIVRGALHLTHPSEFAAWAQSRGAGRLVMEDFYRWQRRRLDVLMDGERPVEGRWNLDRENRQPPPARERPPAPPAFPEDAVDAAVRVELDDLRGGRDAGFGADGPRLFPASRAEALQALDSFVADRLPLFGPWQDAMLGDEPLMWHSLLSSSLNLGLLSPLECVRAAERAYRDGRAPLASVEGYVRQVIGWREYVWGMYWLRAGEWADDNALGADTPLPGAFWTGHTDMRCLAAAVGSVRTHAYAHHIERLMVLGQLTLVLGVRPREAVEWFKLAFVDGFDWVMEPNVTGMATWADGGRMMTKPYASTGRYIDRMSNHCAGCRYDPKQRVGDRACPYSTLYWDFHARHADVLGANRRLRGPYLNLERMDPDELAAIRERAAALRLSFDV